MDRWKKQSVQREVASDWAEGSANCKESMAPFV